MDSTRPSREDGSVQAHSSIYRYSLKYKNIGKCVIINNENFSGMNKRIGTEEDGRKVREAFGSLGFTVQMEKDLSCAEMRQVLDTVSREDHGEMACFACVILSHGYKGHIYGTDREIKIKELTALFSAQDCPSLAGKPKLFFIQACRGEEYDGGVETDSTEAEDIDISEIPEEDFLCAHSTAAGYYSWRNQVRGSIFIRRLCEMLDQHGRDLDLARILTRVSHWVALRFESDTGAWLSHGKKQMPCIISRLTRDLYFSE
ncbi:caspase-7-like isoform X2 [Lepisosteus oculatus]|uniref:caspase-7-like isoform X2 n=1 Tax=Lepisosteus oculatus TaxID=7918 RepID=UPI0035F4FEF3